MRKLYFALRRFLQAIVFLGLGFYAIAFSLQITNILQPLEYLYGTPRGRLISLAAGIVFIFYALLSIYVRSKANSAEKSISFDNPVGKVKISLSAIEDFIRKIALQISGIHEIRPRATAQKNKIIVDNRVVIWGTENLLNTSNKAQEAIRSYLEEILGGEEKVEINMHVVKVLQDVTKIKPETPQDLNE